MSSCKGKIRGSSLLSQGYNTLWLLYEVLEAQMALPYVQTTKVIINLKFNSPLTAFAIRLEEVWKLSGGRQKAWSEGMNPDRRLWICNVIWASTVRIGY